MTDIIKETNAVEIKVSGIGEKMPTIGRIVIFQSGEMINGTHEHPAIITRVWNNTTLNLTVFLDAQSPVAKTSVLPGKIDGWRWP